MDKKTYQEFSAQIERDYEAGDITCASVHPLLENYMNEEINDPRLSMIVNQDRLSQQIAICLSSEFMEILETCGVHDTPGIRELLAQMVAIAIGFYQTSRMEHFVGADLTPLRLDQMHAFMSDDESRFLTHDEILERIQNGGNLKQYEDDRRKPRGRGSVQATVIPLGRGSSIKDILEQLEQILGDEEPPTGNTPHHGQHLQ